jgi:hypothetical protein
MKNTKRHFLNTHSFQSVSQKYSHRPYYEIRYAALNEFLITGAIGMYFENFSVEAAMVDQRSRSFVLNSSYTER